MHTPKKVGGTDEGHRTLIVQRALAKRAKMWLVGLLSATPVTAGHGGSVAWAHAGLIGLPRPHPQTFLQVVGADLRAGAALPAMTDTSRQSKPIPLPHPTTQPVHFHHV